MRAELARAYELAAGQEWVASRGQLAACGVTRWMVRDRLASGDWTSLGRHTVALRRGDLAPAALRSRAVWESGRLAALDGASALLALGLTGFDLRAVHVSVPHGRTPIPVAGVVRHVVGLRQPGEVVGRVDEAVSRYRRRWPRCAVRSGPCLIGRRPSSSCCRCSSG